MDYGYGHSFSIFSFSFPHLNWLGENPRAKKKWKEDLATAILLGLGGELGGGEGRGGRVGGGSGFW